MAGWFKIDFDGMAVSSIVTSVHVQPGRRSCHHHLYKSSPILDAISPHSNTTNYYKYHPGPNRYNYFQIK
eukprot:747262-Amphidinium_carterae.1